MLQNPDEKKCVLVDYPNPINIYDVIVQYLQLLYSN